LHQTLCCRQLPLSRPAHRCGRARETSRLRKAKAALGGMGWGEVGRGCAKGGRQTNRRCMTHVWLSLWQLPAIAGYKPTPCRRSPSPFLCLPPAVPFLGLLLCLRFAPGARERYGTWTTQTITVAILAQGTHWAVALAQAFLHGLKPS